MGARAASPRRNRSSLTLRYLERKSLETVLQNKLTHTHRGDSWACRTQGTMGIRKKINPNKERKMGWSTPSPPGLKTSWICWQKRIGILTLLFTLELTTYMSLQWILQVSFSCFVSLYCVLNKAIIYLHLRSSRDPKEYSIAYYRKT